MRQMRTIYLIRHGRPDVPLQARLCIGRTDLPLGAPGRMQACLLAQELDGRAVTAVFSSPLRRTRETAAFLSPEPIVKNGLEEISVGDWEGLDFSEIARRWPALYAARGSDPATPIPNAEDAAHAQARFLAAVEAALAASRGDIAIVAHMAVNQALLCHAAGRPPHAGREFPFPHGAYCVLTYDGAYHIARPPALPEKPLTPRLAERLLDAADPGERVKAHCRAVAREALRIAGALPRPPDRELLAAAALLHDAARGERRHAETGAAWLRLLGYDDAAALVAQHHDFTGGTLDAAALLFLADKCVQEERRVSLEARFQASRAACRDSAALRAHEARWRTALALKEQVNSICGGEVVL